jgi:hypothetical protein
MPAVSRASIALLRPRERRELPHPRSTRHRHSVFRAASSRATATTSLRPTVRRSESARRLRLSRSELVVTLDNGQVWAQKEVGAYFPLKAGDPVAILAGTLGSFRLICGNRATAVTRVQ